MKNGNIARILFDFVKRIGTFSQGAVSSGSWCLSLWRVCQVATRPPGRLINGVRIQPIGDGWQGGGQAVTKPKIVSPRVTMAAM